MVMRLLTAFTFISFTRLQHLLIMRILFRSCSFPITSTTCAVQVSVASSSRFATSTRNNTTKPHSYYTTLLQHYYTVTPIELARLTICSSPNSPTLWPPFQLLQMRYAARKPRSHDGFVIRKESFAHRALHLLHDVLIRKYQLRVEVGINWHCAWDTCPTWGAGASILTWRKLRYTLTLLGCFG